MQEELERAGFKQVPYGKKYVWSEGVFGRLLTAMEIAKAEVEWLQQIDPAAVVFRTGWRRFAPSDGDLRDPSLVPWHPYLMHPYLSSEAADFLVSSMHLRAIGSDHVHGLDSPLRYVFHGTTSPDLSHCRPDVVQALREDAESGKALPDWRIYWHLHTTALGRGLQLLENLYLPLEVLCPTRVEHSTGGVPFRRGRLLVISFSFGGRPDVELVSAFFAPGVWRDGNE
jgi:kynurenine formamidase